MSTARFNTLQNAAGSVSVPVDTVVNGSAKAWVNFNGTGTVAIRRGFNVSSITDNGTGDYTLNFITAMVDTTYAVVASSEKYATTNWTYTAEVIDGGKSVSGVRLVTGYVSGTASGNYNLVLDVGAVSAVIFR